MYFPYLRGKQEELLAVTEAAARLGEGRVVYPVLEPVRESFGQLLRACEALDENGVLHAVVENPCVGDLVGSAAVRDVFLPDALARLETTRPAFIIHPGLRDSHVSEFLQRYPGRPVVLIHETSYRSGGEIRGLADSHGQVEYHIFVSPGTASAYRRVFAGQGRVLLEDAFIRLARNADYVERDPEHFSSAHLTFREDELDGFGDYSIVGKTFKDDRGGQAHAVVAHVTYPEEEEGRINIHHFVSDDTAGEGDVAGKTIQALRKAVRFARETAPLLDFSSAVEEWADAVRRDVAPGLGPLKRQSIRHHLELMDAVLGQQGL